MGWVVYILRCGDGTLYTGCTNDLPHRLEAHRGGRGAKYTRSRLPVELAYQEEAAGGGHQTPDPAGKAEADRERGEYLCVRCGERTGGCRRNLPGRWWTSVPTPSWP